MNNFFNSVLQSSEVRIAPSRHYTRFHLDKNEQSDDLDMDLKHRIMESVMNANWNRYPASDYKDIESKIAEYCRLAPENIVLSAGSASIITTLLDYFALNNKSIHIAQPSYSLFDYHCKTYNIPFTPWYLTEDLEFDYAHLPDLDHDSVLIITSPNNPVGNTIDTEKLTWLLETYPDSMIILDAVYTEFSDQDFTTLVNKYQNLIVLRSFSKAFPIAGLRLGYLCAAPQTAAIVKKLILQFSITHFSLIFARELLFDNEFMEISRNKVEQIVYQRQKLAKSISNRFGNDILKVFPSQGNFLLIRIFDDSYFAGLMETFTDYGIKVLNSSGFPLLKNTFRVSVGNPDENKIFMQCLSDYLEQRIISRHALDCA